MREELRLMGFAWGFGLGGIRLREVKEEEREDMDMAERKFFSVLFQLSTARLGKGIVNFPPILFFIFSFFLLVFSFKKKNLQL